MFACSVNHCTKFVTVSLRLKKTFFRILKTLKFLALISHFNFRAGSTFPVPVYTVPHGHWVNKADNQIYIFNPDVNKLLF